MAGRADMQMLSVWEKNNGTICSEVKRRVYLCEIMVVCVHWLACGSKASSFKLLVILQGQHISG